MDELTKVIAEAHINGCPHHGEVDVAPQVRPVYCATADRIAAALAPLIEARVREAYREGLRHGSDELDPEEFGDA